MKRQVAMYAFVGMILFGLAIAACQNESPTGKATGSVARSAEATQFLQNMWGALAAYQEPFLAKYSGQLQGRPDDPLVLLKAYDELMYSVTGPTGLWRSYVPKQHFGCSANHALPVCQQFERLELSFLPWETFHVQLSSINSADEAEAFLTVYSGKLGKFLEYYVPKDKSLAAIQSTPFFQDQLAIFVK